MLSIRYLPLKAQLNVTFDFFGAIVARCLNDEVRHIFLVKWLIMKSDCSFNEASAHCLSSGKRAWKLCAYLCECMHVHVCVHCWLREGETYSTECFYHQKELPLKFSSVFPPGTRTAFWTNLSDISFSFNINSSHQFHSISWEVNHRHWLPR